MVADWHLLVINCLFALRYVLRHNDGLCNACVRRHFAYYREDAFAALQLYLQHVRDDPALMTYQELVEFELRNLGVGPDHRRTVDLDGSA